MIILLLKQREKLLINIPEVFFKLLFGFPTTQQKEIILRKKKIQKCPI